MSSSRILTISPHYQMGTHKTVPSLRLSGQWLGKLGFQAGQKVQVITRNELLVIQLLPTIDAEVAHNARLLKEMNTLLRQLHHGN